MSKDSFYASRSTAWWKVALAMIGSCMSGVTFVSVPGMVGASGFGYLQMCLGFFLGYLVIAFVLTPLYFRLGVVSIYQYLEKRFGIGSYRTGAWFFFISKMLGTSVKMFLLCSTIQLLLGKVADVSFLAVAAPVMLLEWAYTVRGGVKAVIGLDMLKTVIMLLSVGLTLFFVARAVDGPDTSLMRVFYFDDPLHPQYFWKQLVGGLCIVVATTGLDQDMMQRTLACRNVRDSQKNLVVSSLLQTVVIAMFLLLGTYLYKFASLNGIQASGDAVFPAVVWSGAVPAVVGVLFVTGLVMAGFPSGGSALTALTTSFTVDLSGRTDHRSRVVTHTLMTIVMLACMVAFNKLNSTSVIDATYRLASYTYGPILGLFVYGMGTRRPVRDGRVPVIAILSPAISLVLDLNSEQWFGGYHFSYELLLLNAGITVLGLLLSSLFVKMGVNN